MPQAGTSTVLDVTLRWAAMTDVGRVRQINEDSILAEPPVFAVADGMGGHSAGEVASGLAIERLRELVAVPPRTAEDVSVLLNRVNAEILAGGAPHGERRPMGTTAVGLVLLDDAVGQSWVVFNIGDSRIYRSAGGEFERLSTDHSYVQELIDTGRLTELEARDHPQRNVVTRVLGVDEDSTADLWVRSPVPGERFLLCSDGLSGEVEDSTIQSLLSDLDQPRDVVSAMVELARSSGGHDNISVIVVDTAAVDGFDVVDEITAPHDAATAGGLIKAVPARVSMVHAEPDDDRRELVPDGAPTVDQTSDESAAGLISTVPASLASTGHVGDLPTFELVPDAEPVGDVTDDPSDPSTASGSGMSSVDSPDVDVTSVDHVEPFSADLADGGAGAL